MNILEEKILNEGKILPGEIIKVDSFLNHQIDIHLINEMAKLYYEHFKDKRIDKIITIEASGIPLAFATALVFDVPLLFAKKAKSSNLGDVYSTLVKSYTYGNEYQITIDKSHCNEDENVLIIDDFLAKGNALKGLIDICNQANFNIVGLGVAIEKGFQGGGDELRKLGYDLYSLAIIESIKNNQIEFRK